MYLFTFTTTTAAAAAAYFSRDYSGLCYVHMEEALGAGCPSCHPTSNVKALKENSTLTDNVEKTAA